MGVLHDVTEAPNPQAALVALAAALERIEESLATSPVAGDGWGTGWAASPPGSKPALTISEDTVTFHDPPLELKQKRGDFARDVLRLEEALPDLGDGAVEAFITGGPLWLHAYDRDYVVALPVQIKQQLVADVDIYDNAAAADLARDLLKGESTLPDFSPTV